MIRNMGRTSLSAETGGNHAGLGDEFGLVIPLSNVRNKRMAVKSNPFSPFKPSAPAEPKGSGDFFAPSSSKFDSQPTILYPGIDLISPRNEKKQRIPNHYGMKSAGKDWHMNCLSPPCHDFPGSPQNPPSGFENGTPGRFEKSRRTIDPIKAREGLMKEERSAFSVPIPGILPFSLLSLSLFTPPVKVLSSLGPHPLTSRPGLSLSYFRSLAVSPLACGHLFFLRIFDSPSLRVRFSPFHRFSVYPIHSPGPLSSSLRAA